MLWSYSIFCYKKSLYYLSCNVKNCFPAAFQRHVWVLGIDEHIKKAIKVSADFRATRFKVEPGSWEAGTGQVDEAGWVLSLLGRGVQCAKGQNHNPGMELVSAETPTQVHRAVTMWGFCGGPILQDKTTSYHKARKLKQEWGVHRCKRREKLKLLGGRGARTPESHSYRRWCLCHSEGEI